MNTEIAVSADGTGIAFERTGGGPAVVLVASALADRADTRRLAALLAPQFTVINYDRRGRGASGDTPPYAVEREVEDIAALIDAAGGSAFLFGSSSGAALTLTAASHGLDVAKIAVYEPPFIVSRTDPAPPPDLADHVDQLIAADRRAEAVTYFMTKAIGMPAVVAHLMRLMPRTWSKLKAMAPTISYDVAVMADTQAGRPLREDQWAAVKVPTLVLNGGKSPAYLARAAAALADVLPDARLLTLAGVSHSAVVMRPKVLAPVLQEFFAADDTAHGGL